jgi:hypothetical protein
MRKRGPTAIVTSRPNEKQLCEEKEKSRPNKQKDKQKMKKEQGINKNCA